MDPGSDHSFNPRVPVYVDVPDRSGGHSGDDIGSLSHCQGFWTGRGVLGSYVALRVRERRRHDGCDVLGVDERLRAVAGRHDDGAVDRHQESLAEVLHEPGRPHDRVGQPGTAHEVQLDRPQGDLDRGKVHAIGAEEGDVPHARGLSEVEEG